MRTARAGDVPLGNPALGERTFVPLPGGNELSRPLASYNPKSSPRLLGDVAIRPGPGSWDHGLRTFPRLYKVRCLRTPRRAGRLSGCPRRPGLSWGSGAAACNGRTVTGLTAPTGHRGSDLPPSGEGSGAATCHPCRGSRAGPATCLQPEALCVSPAHLPAFNAVAGPGAPKSKRAACHWHTGQVC
jgi:hypothetical protein